MIRILAIATAVLAVLWAGWWWVGATGIRRGLEDGAAAARDAGWDLAWDDLSVSGFPNRFDATLTAPAAAPPGGAWRWSAPFLQVFALSYRPNHVIAVGPPEQEVETDAGTFRVTEDDLRASVVVAPGTDLALDRATLVARGVTVEGPAGDVTVGSGQVALRGSGEPNGYALALDLEAIGLPTASLPGLGAAGGLPATVDALRGQGVAILDRPLDRHLDGVVGVEALTLDPVSLRWGDLVLALRGDLVADAAGLAEGVLEIDAGDPDALVGILRPYLPSGQAELLRSFVAAAGAEDGWVRLPVSGGAVRVGPFPVATLPVMDPPG